MTTTKTPAPTDQCPHCHSAEHEVGCPIVARRSVPAPTDAVKEAIALVERHKGCNSAICIVPQPDDDSVECETTHLARPILAALAEAERQLAERESDWTARYYADANEEGYKRAMCDVESALATANRDTTELRALWNAVRQPNERGAERYLRAVDAHPESFDIIHRLAKANKRAEDAERAVNFHHCPSPLGNPTRAKVRGEK